MSENQNSPQNPVTIFTDGSSLGNPGPGGWCAILTWNNTEKVFSQGYVKTTNNRMELRGVIHALQELTRPCSVHVYTDSRYVCDAVEKKWIANWIRKGWLTAGKKPVKNKDLWEALLPLLKKHHITFFWVKGHAGHPENERCDVIAKAAASQAILIKDDGYEDNQ